MKFLAAFFVALALTITWQTYTLAQQHSDPPPATAVSPDLYPGAGAMSVAWN